MQSVKSCFNPTLFRKNVTRFWPVWALYLILWVLAMPLQILRYKAPQPASVLSYFPFGVGMAAVFGLLSAMAVFSYLYNSRSVQLMHSLPVTREGLYLTNYLSGLAFLLVPNVLVFLLSLLAGGHAFPSVLVLWLAAHSLISFFFYSFAVFCAMFTGNLLALPIFYGILNWLVMVVIAVVNALLQELLFGFWGTTRTDAIAEWFTPIYKLTRAVRYDTTPSGIYYLTGMSAILVYALVGLVLAVAALLIYRKRRLETAGDVVSVRQIRPVFKYGVALCSAVVIGTWFYQTFRSLLPGGLWAILLPLLVWGAAGYLVAEILLRKTFRVLSKSWKGLAVFSLSLVAVFAFTSMDLFGFNRPPARSDVVSVSFSDVETKPYDKAHYATLNLSDPADIDAVLRLHGIIAANKNALQAGYPRGGGYNTAWQEGPLSDSTAARLQSLTTTDLTIKYTLADGQVIRRQYRLPLQAENLADPGSLESLLTEFLNRPSILEKSYWDGLIKGASLAYTSLNIYDTEQQAYTTVEFPSQADRERLLAAVQADMAAGRIGRRYLFDNAERLENCYYNDLAFTFFVPKSNLSPQATEDWSLTVNVTLQTTSTETLKVLRELGYSGDRLVTWAEQVKRDGKDFYPSETEAQPQSIG